MRTDIFGGMPATVEMQLIGSGSTQTEVRGIIEHIFADRSGDWKVTIVGSQADDLWEMKILGPNAFERSYTLDGTAGEHEPRIIGRIVVGMLPGE